MEQARVTNCGPRCPLDQQLSSAQQMVEQAAVAVRQAFDVRFPKETNSILQVLILAPHNGRMPVKTIKAVLPGSRRRVKPKARA